MNKVFKVIWSEARNAYVVVSEIAKNHGSKSCSTKKLLTMLIATGVMTCASMAPAMAGNPAPDDLNVTIGNGAHISVWNGSTGQNINGDIAVGPNAHAWNGEYSYTDPFSKRVYPRIGSKEYLMDFGQGAVENVIDLSIKPHYKVVDGSKIAGSIAIGKNTIARTGSVMLGDHSYTGKLGDVEINPKDAMTYNDGIYSTTLGAGAYNSGSLAAVTGALSIASGKKDKDTQNTGATIYGSLNSIESATNDSNYSGVASSVLGFANRTQNANAALIWGTGNEVTNSIEDVKGIDFKKWSSQSVSDAQKDAIEAMQSSKYAGGSVLAIGGGNKADYAKYSQLTGVQNKVTGTKSENAKYDFVNGYQNIVKDASDVTVIGTKNEVTADGNKVIGDNHQVSGKNNVIFGSVKELTETTVNNAVVLGYNAKVTGEGGVVLGYNAKVTGKDGVALGAGSVADRANAVSVGSSVKGNKITRQIINVAEGTEDTDAVNVSQLHQTNENVAELDNRVTANEKAIAQNKADIATNAENIKQNATDIAQNKNDIKNLDNRVTNVEELAKKHTTVTAGDNIVVSEDTNKDGGKEYKVALDKDINLDSVTTGDTTITDKGLEIKDGPSVTKDGINAGDKKITGVADGDIKEGSTDAINGSQLHQTNENVAELDNRVTANEKAIAQNKADIATNAENIKQNATDIAQNKNDIKNLDNRVTNVEELAKKHTTVTAGDNIVVSEDTNKDGGKEYKVALDKDINLDSVTTGDTTITDKGLEIKDGPSVTKDGINAGDKKITGVADGDIKEGSTDAINGGQLHQAKADINNRIDGVENQVINNTNRINKLGSRVNKVGAGAAALAALHPMDFDPDDKLTFSAGYGNYAGENAAAIGAYYRPDEKVMFSVAGTVGNGENMVNAGVSFALDRTNHVSNSRTALAREVIDLRGQLAVMGAKMAKMEKAFGMLDETKTKLFPDVPANHWAYEYIAKLAGNGYIEGYPDGNFGGDRLMTRYEFAAMLYRAIENGAALEEKIIKEFEPELGRIRVDRISGEDGDRDKIERVRVNDTKGERDHYGNKLAK